MARLVVVVVVVLLRLGGAGGRGLEVDIEFHTRKAGLFGAGHLQAIACQGQLSQLPLQLGGIGAQVQERPDQHVAADAAGQVEIEGFHWDCWARALIWLAA